MVMLEMDGAREEASISRVRRREAGAGELAEAALQVILEALDGAAFVVVGSGPHVARANDAGRALLDADPEGTLRRLRAAVDPMNGVVDGKARLISAAGLPSQHLVVFSDLAARVAARVALATRAWDLTPRQAAALGLLAGGLPNKLVASALGCAERTAELHTTVLLEKAGAGSRAELVARFWSSLEEG